MKERYKILKYLYKDYLVILKVRNKKKEKKENKLFLYKYISYDIDNKILKYLGKFKNKGINYIVLDGTIIIDKYESDNNNYELIKTKVLLKELINKMIKKLKNERNKILWEIKEK